MSAAGVDGKGHKKLLTDLCNLLQRLQASIGTLEKALGRAGSTVGCAKQAAAYRDLVIPAMNAVREAVDGLEQIVDCDYWPLPTYAEMLFLR